MEINWKKNTALFLTGQALSFFGTMIVQFAILWHITLKSQSGTIMALFIVAGFLPILFIAPFAGVWADRYNKKNIINLADGLISFFSLVVAVFLFFGIDNYGILLACAFVRSVGQGVQSPAVRAFIPQIVPKDHLTKINGFQSSINSFVTLTSPMLGGALMTFAPLEALFFLDVVTAIIAIFILFFFVKIPQKEETELKIPVQNSKNYFSELKEGLKYIKNHGFVIRIVLISAIYIFLFVPAGLLKPLQVTRNFGADVWRLTAIEITFSVGILAGGVLIGVWGGFKKRVHTMTLSFVLCGLLIIGSGFVQSFWLYLAILFLIGFSTPLGDAPFNALLQSTVEPSFMGRVFSVVMTIISTMNILGMLFFGLAADIVSINILFLSTGLLIFLLCIPLITSKTLRKEEETKKG